MNLDKILAYAQSQGSSLILSSLLPDGFTCAPAEDRMTRMERVLAFSQGQDPDTIALSEVDVKEYTRRVRGKVEVVRPHQETRRPTSGIVGGADRLPPREPRPTSGIVGSGADRLPPREPRPTSGIVGSGAGRPRPEPRPTSGIVGGGKADTYPPREPRPTSGIVGSGAAGQAAYAARGKAAWEAGRQEWPHPDAVGGHKVQGVYTHPKTGNALYDLGNGLHAEGVPGKGGQFRPGGVMKSNTGLQKEALAAKGWKFGRPPSSPASLQTGLQRVAGAGPQAAVSTQGRPGSLQTGLQRAAKSPLEKVAGARTPKAGAEARKIQAGLAAQQQDYMQRHGFKIDPADWHQDWVPPHEDRIHPEFGPPSGDIKDLSKPGREGAEGTAADPIDVKGDSKEALRQLAQGKHVRLNKPAELTLLMQQIARHAAETEESGKPAEAPDWDFGRLSVKGTNLFAAQSKGIRRIHMPQFSGLATPGSHAAQVAGGAGKFADLTDEFEQHLKDKGIGVTRTTMPASHLKATQSELVGAKVAGFANAFLHGNPKAVKAMSEPIMVTKDGYVIDGHHRWGANMLVDAVDGKLGDDAPMNVRKVDMEIGAMIPYANHWAATNGIQSAAASAADTGAALKK